MRFCFPVHNVHYRKMQFAPFCVGWVKNGAFISLITTQGYFYKCVCVCVACVSGCGNCACVFVS